MSTLPHNAKTIDLLKWVAANPNKPFDPNMVVSLSTNHASDWEWQAVLGQMEDLRLQNYIMKLKQDPGGSTYWTITSKGESYVLALERAESAMEEPTPQLGSAGVSAGSKGQRRFLVSSVIPSPDALLRLTPEEAACPLLNCLLSLSENELNRHNFFISNYPTEGYPPEHHEKIKSKLAAAWNWLQGQGYLVPRPGNPGSDWVSITDDGREWAKVDCGAERMEQLRGPKSQRTSPSGKSSPDRLSARDTATAAPPEQPVRVPSSEPVPSGGVDVAIRALSDKPSEIDLLEFADYAQALADFIENEKTQTPLTIGIDGAWGSGKTTLMKMIQTRLAPEGKGRNDDPSARTVWFNAWKYDREESLWASLALEILSQVRQQCRVRERVGLWFRLNWKRFDRGKYCSDLLKFIVYPSGLLIATVLGAFVWKGWVGPQVDVAKWTKVAVGGGIVTTLLAALKQIHNQVVGPFELNISKYIRTPDYGQRIGFLGEFEKDFKFVIDAVTDNAKLSLVIFIDDLDRCKPAKPVEVIEAINQLLDAEPCIFVMGMDVRSIAGSIEAKYKDLAESSLGQDLSGGLPLGYRFLEKIVQVPFRLPQVSRKALVRLVDGSLIPRVARLGDRGTVVAEAEHLIESEEGRGKGLDEAAETVRSARPDISSDALMEAKRNVFARTFDDDQEVRNAIYDAVPYLEANARKVKRFINLFRLQLLIANRRHLLEDGVIEIRQLARWLVLVGSWPEIVDALNDPAFPPRLLEAHRLWRGSVAEHPGLENAQATQVLLKPFLDDPRIKRFMDVSNLVSLLRVLIPERTDRRDLSNPLEPYLQLSAISPKQTRPAPR